MSFEVDNISAEQTPKIIEKDLVKPKAPLVKKMQSQGGPNIKNLRQPDEKKIITNAVDDP